MIKKPQKRRIWTVAPFDGCKTSVSLMPKDLFVFDLGLFYLTTLSVAQSRERSVVAQLMSNDLERMWVWPDLKYCSSIRL
jgi:hypothetical protein